MHTTTQLAGDVIREGAPAARVAHAALFERVMTRIHRYFARMIRDSHEAEDCLQKTLVLLEQSLVKRNYDPSRSFNTWMWLKARTVFAQYCRDHERRLAGLEDPADAPDPRAVQEAAERQLDAQAILERLRERLGPEAFEAFVLYYEGGLTQAEVAAALDRDRKTVRKRIAEAHAIIDELLS
jgi:RNA polymerase sigma factor (sigma-70 family)